MVGKFGHRRKCRPDNNRILSEIITHQPRRRRQMAFNFRTGHSQLIIKPMGLTLGYAGNMIANLASLKPASDGDINCHVYCGSIQDNSAGWKATGKPENHDMAALRPASLIKPNVMRNPLRS